MENKVSGIKITSPDKIVFKKDKITKLDVVSYYNSVAPLMLPYLDRRLLSVIRCHQGIDGEKFFKKHPTTEREGVEVFDDDGDEYFYVKNKTQLVFQAQMGSLEFHTWGSQVPETDKPNLMVFDLDPSESLSLEKLRAGAVDLKNLLEDLSLKTFLKTSGGKGYHIVVPTNKFKDWDSFSEFARNVALVLEAKFPSKYTSNIRKAERKGKIFIDYLRNSKGATCVAPFSLRARDNAPLSLPISWDNLNEIKPNQVTLKNFSSYLDKSAWRNFPKKERTL